MRLRILSLLWLTTVLAVPPVFADGLPSPAALGEMEGWLDSCSKADPKSAPDFEKQRDRLVQGASNKDLAQVRATDDYKAAYKAFRDRFEKAPKDDAMKACRIFL